MAPLLTSRLPSVPFEISQWSTQTWLEPLLDAYVQMLGPSRLVRGVKKFGIIQVSSAERLDIGIKLKGVAATDRFEPSGAWNAMVTHRVRITDAKQIDKDVLAWLKQAYTAAV